MTPRSDCPAHLVDYPFLGELQKWVKAGQGNRRWALTDGPYGMIACGLEWYAPDDAKKRYGIRKVECTAEHAVWLALEEFGHAAVKQEPVKEGVS